MTSSRISERLRAAVGEALPVLSAAAPSRTLVRPAPEAWCAREVLEHLIDSACNNHRRFVIGQWTPTLAFEGYDQDSWVSHQRYDQASWEDLVQLWAAYNRHLAHVIAVAPDAVLDTGKPHTIHLIGVTGVRPDAPATLALLMDDYVTHLQHHLDQIRALLA